MIANPIVARETQVVPGSGSTVVFEASTMYGVATLAAAIDAGLWVDSSRRILLLANNSTVPETAPTLQGGEGFDHLATRFTEIWSFNEIIHPHHPAIWNPRTHEYPVLTRYLTLLLDIPSWGPHQLVVESIHVSPAKLLCALFGGAGVDVYSEGLMSYGPTRENLPALTGRRIERMIYPDLVPGLTPLLLKEWEPENCRIAPERLRAVFEELAADVEPPVVGDGPIALVLGQYLSALGLMTITEEADVYASLVAALARAGHTNIVFKPHPNAPAAMETELERAASQYGVSFTVLREQMLSEVLLCLVSTSVVVGSFSTGLITALRLFGVPAYHTHTLELSAQLAPVQNSNRFPLTLINTTLPDVSELESPNAPHEVGAPDMHLLTALGHAMHPERVEAPAGMTDDELHSLISRHLPARSSVQARHRDAAADDPHGNQHPLGRRTRIHWAWNKIVKAVAWRLRKGVTKAEKRLTA